LRGQIRLDDSLFEPLPEEELAGFVSAASAWEITTKHRLGKLPGAALAAADLDGLVEAQGFEALAITLPHAAQAGRLPGPQRDPFDRYGVRRLW
jgi:PIN domain nuclease of toxin-antitoxin system